MNKNNLGFIFELGFNMGILSCLPKEKRLYFKKYLEDDSYNRDRVYSVFTHNIPAEHNRDIIRKNIDWLLYKGRMSGENCYKEWIDSKLNQYITEYTVEYFQANFLKVCDESRFQATNEKGINEKKYYSDNLRQQLGISLTPEETSNYMDTGEALRADTILLIKTVLGYHLFVIDNSITLKNIIDYEDLDRLKRTLNSAIFTKRIKSSFSNLAIDSEDAPELAIEDALASYIGGLSKDKPLYKMIQAGSYAHSFKELLLRRRILKNEDIVSVCVMGYTDEEICSLNLNNTQFAILKTCYDTYRNAARERDSDAYIKKKENVFAKITNRFASVFKLDTNKIEALTHLHDEMNTISFEETMNDYQNTVGDCKYEKLKGSYRDVHAELIKKYIQDKDSNILFLTGNPGIGKTTAIVEYLKEQEGYLFVYVSPRTQVNQDIEQKFIDINRDRTRLVDDDLVYLTTNGNDEKRIDGKKVNVVNFRANKAYKYESIADGVKFLPNDRERNGRARSTHFENINDTQFKEDIDLPVGVLKRLTMGIQYVIKNDLSNKIVATAAIQSLKSTSSSYTSSNDSQKNLEQTTARHFNNIFSTVYNSARKKVYPEEFRKLAQRYPNIIFMVDEITGDESGAEFLNYLINVCFNNIYKKLPKDVKQLVNLKIVVADASVNNIDVINKHFNNRNTDSDKIYFRKCNKSQRKSIEAFTFKFKDRYNAVYINTNSYPARELTLKYELFLNVKNVVLGDKLYNKDLKEQIDDTMARDTVDLLVRKVSKQVIIYVQDITRLRYIENKLQQYYIEKVHEKLERGKDYITINSTISDAQRKEVFEYKDDAKIVLMTSSASRGISFPNATSILVDVPRFDTEKNMMEILQLIYRGRGKSDIDRNDVKRIKFYIGDNIYYKDKDDVVIAEHEQQRTHRQLMIQEHLVSIFTLLMLLRISILTRIYGSAFIGKDEICLVPVCGKGVGSISSALIEEFAAAVKNLQKEYYKDQSNKGIEQLVQELTKILGNSDVRIGGEIYNSCTMSSIKTDFHKVWDKGMMHLLDFKPFNNPVIVGNLMIFKVSKEIQTYLAFIQGIADRILDEKNLVNKLYAKAYNDNSLSLTLRNELKTLGDTFSKVAENSQNISQSLRDTTQSDDRFVVIPLITPFIYDSFKDYDEREEDNTFKSILTDYVRAYYSIGQVLPIGSEYKDFPFITFRSASLVNMRKRIYSPSYMFCSNELNILNLFLLKE